MSSGGKRRGSLLLWLLGYVCVIDSYNQRVMHDFLYWRFYDRLGVRLVWMRICFQTSWPSFLAPLCQKILPVILNFHSHKCWLWEKISRIFINGGRGPRQESEPFLNFFKGIDNFRGATPNIWSTKCALILFNVLYRIVWSAVAHLAILISLAAVMHTCVSYCTISNILKVRVLLHSLK